MALEHARAGESIDVRPLGAAITDSRTKTLVKTDRLEVIRLVLAKGKLIDTHQAPGPITLQCLEGRIAFTAGDAQFELSAGQMLFLEAAQPHSVRAEEDSSALLTIAVGEPRGGTS